MEVTHDKGPVIHFNIAGRAYVILNDPDDIKVSTVLTQSRQYEPLIIILNYVFIFVQIVLFTLFFTK